VIVNDQGSDRLSAALPPRSAWALAVDAAASATANMQRRTNLMLPIVHRALPTNWAVVVMGLRPLIR
jgi:hypothetical protein